MVVDIRRLSVIAVVAAGCGSTSLPFLDEDAAPVMDDGAVVDAPPTRAGTSPAHLVYLNFEGGTFLAGADDAVGSSTSILASGTADFDPFAKGAGNRDVQITTILTEVSAILAPYGVRLVKDRPPDLMAEPLQEIVVTGAPPVALGIASTTGAIQPLTCTPRGNEVAFVFGAPAVGEHLLVERIIAVLGLFSQVPLTDEQDDCMCYLAQNCTAPVFACTIGSTIRTVDAADDACVGANAPQTFDENAAWLAAFGPPP